MLCLLVDHTISKVHFVVQIPIGAENVGLGADDLEELQEDEDEYIKLGHEQEHEQDFSKLQLKPDHQNRHPSSLPCTAVQHTQSLRCIVTTSMAYHAAHSSTHCTVVD